MRLILKTFENTNSSNKASRWLGSKRLKLKMKIASKLYNKDGKSEFKVQTLNAFYCSDIFCQGPWLRGFIVQDWNFQLIKHFFASLLQFRSSSRHENIAFISIRASLNNFHFRKGINSAFYISKIDHFRLSKFYKSVI